MSEINTGSSALKSPWVWGWIGMIVLVFAANITMIYFAASTSPGLVVEDYYEKGKNYDKTLEDRQKEKRLSWQVKPDVPKKIILNRVFPVGLSVVSKVAEEALPDKATIYLFRPSDSSADFSVTMDMKAAGVFVAELLLPLPGRWDIIFSMSSMDENKEVTHMVFVDKASQP